VVANYFKVDSVAILEPGSRSPARPIAMALCRENRKMQLSDIAKNFGNISYSATSKNITLANTHPYLMPEL
jgi:chromosomal replication initiation ATPase DnaA